MDVSEEAVFVITTRRGRRRHASDTRESSPNPAQRSDHILPRSQLKSQCEGEAISLSLRSHAVSPRPKIDGDGHEVQTELVPIERNHEMGYFSTVNLILNKIVGTGIFVSPAVVLNATQSKGISLFLWLVGCFVTWAGLSVYLEYGTRWPLTGGELYYVDKVYTRPLRLFTYMFASMFILVGGVQANALTFGREVILAGSGTRAGTAVDTNLQKFFAIIIVTFVCQLQAFSRSIYIRMSNLLALFKISSLVVISICGILAIFGVRRENGSTIGTPYGRINLENGFSGRSTSLYQYSLALLNVMRAFLGYENANLVLEEVRKGPEGDERRTFRRSVTFSVIIVCILYMMTNLAFFVVLTTDEIKSSPEIITLFMEKVFGPSLRAHTASSIVICLSAAGAIMSLTFAYARVKQEIARIGLVPVPELWSNTSHRRTPARALFLHWLFSVVCIIITPLNGPDGFLIMSTFYSYIHTWFSILLGGALLLAPWFSSFRNEDGSPWKSQSSRLGYWVLAPLTASYVAANAFVLLFSFYPPDRQPNVERSSQIFTALIGPIAGHCVLALGVLLWLWDLHILPRLGYIFEVGEEKVFSDRWETEILRVHYSNTEKNGITSFRDNPTCTAYVEKGDA